MGLFDDLIPANKEPAKHGGLFDDLIPRGRASSFTDGLATTFGYNDTEDNGVGAWGEKTNNPDILGVSLPRATLREHFGDENAAKGRMVEVINPATGQRIKAPIVDKGPADWVVQRQGPTIDLTHAANKAIGGTGKTAVQYRILDDDGEIIEPGNIDLHNRPRVQNEDGTFSTVRSISIDADGSTFLIPTVVGDRIVSDEEAIKHFKSTGDHLGRFRNSKAADKYAQTLHEDQAKEYGQGMFDDLIPSPTAKSANAGGVGLFSDLIPKSEGDGILKMARAGFEALSPLPPQKAATAWEALKSLGRGASSEGVMAASEGLYRSASSGIGNVAPRMEVERRITDYQSALENLATADQQRGFTTPESIRQRQGIEQEMQNAQVELSRFDAQGSAEQLSASPAGQAARDDLSQSLNFNADEARRMREGIRETIPAGEAWKGTLGDQLFEGLGQLATIPAYAVPGLGEGVTFGQLYQEGYDDAFGAGATDDQARRAAIEYVAGAAPLEVLLDRLIIGKAMKGAVGNITIGRLAKTFGAMGASGGASEGAQQAWLNTVATQLEGYDPNRPLTQEVAESVLIGGLVSAIGGGGAEVAGSLSAPATEAPPAQMQQYNPEHPGTFGDLSQLPPSLPSEAPPLPSEVPSGVTSPPVPEIPSDEFEALIEEDLQRKYQEYQREEFEAEPPPLPPAESTLGDERFAPPDEIQMAENPEGWVDIDSTPEEGITESADRLFAFSPIPDEQLAHQQRNALSALNQSPENRGTEGSRTRFVPQSYGPNLDMPGPSKAASEFIRQFEKLTGKGVVFVDSNESTPMFAAAMAGGHPNTIFIHARGGRGVRALLGHEWAHTFAAQRPELYRALQRKVLSYSDNPRQRAKSLKSKVYSKPKTLTVELANNMIGDAFLDPEFWSEVNATEPTLFRKIMKAVMEWFDAAIAKVRGSEWGTEAFTRDLSAMRKEVARVFSQAVKDGPYSELQDSNDSDLSFATGPTMRPFVDKGIKSTATMTGNTWEFSRPRFDFQRLYMGTADILDREPKLRFLARAIRKHVDTQRKYMGELSAPYRKWTQQHGRKERKQALREFEGYWREHQRNKALANKAYTLSSPAGQQLIDLWKKTAQITGDINQKNGVMVWDGMTRQLRPIGKVGPEYFPRMINPSVIEILNNPAKNPKGYEQLVREMIAEGMIKTPDDAGEYLKKAVNTFKSNDHFGAIESARSLPLPNKAYDYSFETAQRYMASWSERMAQIEAFGQKLRGHNAGKDLFDMAQELAGDERTKEYIKYVQDRAYNARLDSGWAKLAGGMNALATGLQLGNPMSALKNLISGSAFTAQAYGARRTIAAMGSLVKDFGQIEEAYEKGVLLDDMMNIMQDGEGMGVSRTSGLAKFTQGALNLAGFNSAETFVRGVNMIAARATLRDAIKANQKNPLGRRALQYRGHFAKMGIRSPEALLAESGSGELTNQYLRAAVNEIQGGYRYDQVPAFMDSPVGKFLFKYQKWGSQQLRHCERNVVNPALQFITYGKAGRKEFVKVPDPKTGGVIVKQVPGQLLPLVRYLLFLAAAGLATEKLLGFLFGTPEREASWTEIISELDKEEGRALAMLGWKMWGYHLMAGSLGQLGNYAQMGMDFAQRSRFKNPLDPPGVSPLKGVGNILMDFAEQGTLTAQNVDDLLRSQVSLYRTSKQGAARLNDVFGAGIRPLEFETKRQNLQWLRSVTQRYNQSLGVRKNKTQLGRIGKDEQSPFRDALKQDLLLGDTKAAHNRLREHFAGMKLERKKIELTNLMSSVRASQPIKAGYGNEEMRVNFLGWAMENLSKEDVARVAQVDETYRKAAVSLGLMRVRTDITDDDLNEAMRKIAIKAGR